jgi:dimethylargininase
MPRVFDFNRAIVRLPACGVVAGLRAENRGDPSYDGVMGEHVAYVAVLQSIGVTVTTLPELAVFPDSVFVEDPALVFPEAAILLRPGAKSRFGEVAEIAPALRDVFETVHELPAPGFADGGDILVTPDKVMIGLSARTDEVGGKALAQILQGMGRNVELVRTPPSVLHFKSDCSLLDEETVFSTTRLAVSGVFKGLRVLHVPDGEEGAANALRMNDTVLVSDAYPRSIELLAKRGYKIEPMVTDEISKIDAGLSCMSLRWWDEALASRGH